MPEPQEDLPSPNTNKGAEPASQDHDDKDGSFLSRVAGSLFGNSNVDLQGEIHRQLNDFDDHRSNQQQRGGLFSWNDLEEQMNDVFSEAFSGASSQPSGFGENSTSNNFQKMTMSSWGSGAGSGLFKSSYRMQQNQNGVQIDVDVPSGKVTQDLQVQVIEETIASPCRVEWTTDHQNQQGSVENAQPSRQSTTRRRPPQHMTLGSTVDCERLTATLSQGVLQMKAPLKERVSKETTKTSTTDQGRSVVVTEHDD